MAARLTTLIVVAIVAATLIAGLIVGAQRDDSNGPVDLIVRNAKVYTAAGGGMAEAVAIRGNQILRVGSEREINRLRRPQTVVIDAKGAAVLPGFDDAHVQFIDGGLALERIDLSDARTLEDTSRTIREWAEANPDRPWVLGRGWQYQSFSDGLPTRLMLDAIVSDRPAMLTSRDGHMAWVNTKALQLARIEKRTPNPPHGLIVRDGRGDATGVLKESAIALVEPLVRPTAEEQARALRAAVTQAHSYGITSVQDVGATPEEFETYSEARRTGDLELRVYAALPIDTEPTDAELDRLDRVIAKYTDDPLFKTGAVKLQLDGAVEAGSAALLEPYVQKGSGSEPRFPPDDLNRLVRRLDARGWQILTEAAGDRAVHMALDAYEHAARSNRAPARGRRHRVEHADMVAPADAVRFGPLGVIASVQPFRGSPGDDRLSMWSRLLGADRAQSGWTLHTISGAKGRLAFGSDWPVSVLNPMLALHTAVTRTTPDGAPDDGWVADERIALKSAINAATAGAAWASFDEQRKGTIEPGMLADLVVLSGDIFSAPPSRLATTTVEMTIFDGKIVYRHSDRRTTTSPVMQPD